VSGDCTGKIYLWQPKGDGWVIGEGFEGHSSSVEDLRWQSISNGDVFASASVDKSIRFFDVRQNTPIGQLTGCHDSDVNVISWNPIQGDLLLSGSDDGAVKVWDFRQRDPSRPLAHIAWHKKPISSVSWHPTDEATFAASSGDDSISIWDLSVEADDDSGQVVSEGAQHYPEQLLFHHLGQTEIKEIMWHSYIPGVILSTAGDGFNIFKPSNL